MAASSTWQPVQFFSRSPGSRVFPSAVVHGELLYIFGGHDGSQYRNDLLVFNLETRTWILDLDVTGEGPSPRDAHAARHARRGVQRCVGCRPSGSAMLSARR